ncbi:MAG: Bug family tripartite tricarboxylate transporter substrate binding protein [Actinomycetota bacterium]
MLGSRKTVSLLSALLLVFAAGCGLNTDDSSDDGGGGGGEASAPSETEFLVHTGPGGGSDIFVRDVISMLRDEEIISKNWPVRNEEAGEGAGAMSYLLSKASEDGNISAMTTTWLTTPNTIEGAETTVSDLTPVAGLIIEPEVMAVTADSPYETLTDFVDDAKENPGDLVQAGGSTTEVGALNGKALATEAGTSWEFLSFEEVGQRIAAMLNGDADMMFGSAQDFISQVEAGKLKIIATISPEPSPIYPDAPTTEDEGFTTELVPQVRGIMAPPDIPADALEYYQGVFSDLVETESWQEFAEKNGVVTDLRLGEEWGDFLTEQEEVVREKLDEVGLLIEN